MIPDVHSTALLPPDLAEFRDRYRATVVGPHYNGFAHLAFVVGVSLAVIAVALSFVREPMWFDWPFIPGIFLAANVVEFLGHRGPMHHRVRGMGLMFHRHTHEHHQFFTDDWMTCRSQRDFKIVLFPPVMLLFYLGIVALPFGLLFFFLGVRNICCFYVATATFYFMSYEVLHFTYHLDEKTWVARLPLIRFLRRHHQVHHRTELMTRYNFNINWPFADFLFGTVYQPAAEPAPVDHPESNSAADRCSPAAQFIAS
jgi:hypothetical protein